MKTQSIVALTQSLLVCLALELVQCDLFRQKPLECGALKHHIRLFDKDEIAQPGELGFIVSLTVTANNGTSRSCTASLLSSTRLITSGKCTFGVNDTRSVLAEIGSNGSTDIFEVDKNATISPVIDTVSVCGTMAHRLAIYKLLKPVRFSLKDRLRANRICMEPNEMRMVSHVDKFVYVASYNPRGQVSAPYEVVAITCVPEGLRFICVDPRNNKVKFKLEEGAPVFEKDSLIGRWHLLGVHSKRTSVIGAQCDDDELEPLFIPINDHVIRDWLHEVGGGRLFNMTNKP